MVELDNRLETRTERRERRRDERVPWHIAVRIDFEIDGYNRDLRPFFAKGETLNISRQGLLARIERPVPLGASCTVLFDTATSLVSPKEVPAKVVRWKADSDGVEVAFEFDRPVRLHLRAEEHSTSSPDG